jgi:type I restriction enzyme S subunit
VDGFGKVYRFQQLIDGKILEIGDGYRAKNTELGGDGPAFMRAGRLTASGWDWAGVERFDASDEPKVRHKVSKSGDTVITTKGNSLGRSGFVSADEEPFVYSPHLSYWRSLDKAALNPRFLRYWALGPEMSGHLDSFGHNTDMAPYLSLSDQRRLTITLPRDNTQEAIAGILGALDDKIAVNDRIAFTLEEILTLRFEQLGMIDGRESELAPMSDLIDFNPRESAPKGSVAPYVDMAALPTRQARVRSWGQREPKSGTKFRNGDTLLARITPCLENGKTGYVDSLPDGAVGLGSTEFIVMRAKPGTPRQLPYFLARNSLFREHAIRNMAGTSGRRSRSCGLPGKGPIAT